MDIIPTLFICVNKIAFLLLRFAPLLSPEKLGLVCGEDQSVGLGQLPELGALMLKEYITILKKRSIIDFY